MKLDSYLRKQLLRICTAYDNDTAGEFCDSLARSIVEDAALRAAEAGHPHLYSQAISFRGGVLEARRFLAEYIEACEPRYDARFLTVDAAAAYASLSPESIRRLLAAGKLTALRPVKGRIVIDRNQLDGHVLGSDFRPRKGRGIRR